MAHLDTSGHTPVLILGDAEWSVVHGVAMGKQVAGDRVARRLRRNGILDDDGITPQAAPALHGVAGATRHLDAACFEADGPGRRAEAWIGPRRATLVKHERDGQGRQGARQFPAGCPRRVGGDQAEGPHPVGEALRQRCRPADLTRFAAA